MPGGFLARDASPDRFMKLFFERAGLEPCTLPEPYGSLLALLSDLHEMVELHPATNTFSRDVLTQLKQRIEVLGVLVIAQSRI